MNPEKRKARAIKRFWSRVDIKGPKDCWLWKGKLNWCGQAMSWWEGRDVLVHRIAMEIHLGRPLVSPTRQLDRGEIIRHRCDNPPCCNYRHFLLGTQADNIRDRDNKNRTCRGEHRPASELTENQVKEIRRKYKPYQYSVPKLAREYSMNLSVIIGIIKRKAWKHVK